MWEYLTDSALVNTWLAVADVEPRLGGRVELRMQPKVDGQRVEDCPIIEGTIERWVPTRALTFTWRNIGPGSAGVGEPASELRFEMQADGDRSRLVLEHARLPREWLARVAGGWHYLLDELRARLENRASEPFMATYQAVAPEYERRVAEI